MFIPCRCLLECVIVVIVMSQNHLHTFAAPENLVSGCQRGIKVTTHDFILLLFLSWRHLPLTTMAVDCYHGAIAKSNNLKPRSPWRQQARGGGGTGVGIATETSQGLIGLRVDDTHKRVVGLPQCKPTQVSIHGPPTFLLSSPPF